MAAAAATARANFESRMKITASLPSLTHDTVEDFVRRIDCLYAAINNPTVEDAAHIEPSDRRVFDAQKRTTKQ